MNGVAISLSRHLGVSKNINRLLFILRGYECDLEVHYNTICKSLEFFFLNFSRVRKSIVGPNTSPVLPQRCPSPQLHGKSNLGSPLSYP